MPALPGTVSNYKYRDVPFAVWFDRERISWCLDVREVGRVYPQARGKVVCDLPNAAQAVLVGKQIIEDFWRAARMLPALPPERFHGQQRQLPPAPRKPIPLPPAPPAPTQPIALPPIPESPARAMRGRRYFGMYPKKLEAIHQALQNLSASSFTARDLSQQLGMQPSTHDAQTGRILRWLESEHGFITRAGRRFVLTDAGHRWIASPLVIVTPPSVERPRAKRSAERWRQALAALAGKGSFTPQDFAAQLNATDIHGAALLKRLENDGYVKLVATRGQPGGSFRRYFELTDKGRAWVEGAQENPRSGVHPAALAAIILGVGLLTAGIVSKMMSSTAPSGIASQLGTAALQDAQSDVGVTETSPNSGPRVDQMLANVGVTVPANWCAAAVSTWIFEGATMLGVTRPIQGSASVVVLMNQFRDASNQRVSFLPADYLRAHPEAVAPGMIMILSRGGTGSGLGHTGIVERNLGGGKYATIEGNSGPNSNSVVRNQRDLSSEAFVGMGVLKDMPGYVLPGVGVGYLNDPPGAPFFVGLSGPPLDTVGLYFPDTGLQLEAELARTPAERNEGLSHRSMLPWDRGMLFVFDSSADHGFWMRETAIPLDIVFLDDNFHVVGIIENLQPNDLTQRHLGWPSRYALEVNAGFVRANGIYVGQRVVEIAVPLS